MLLEIDGLAKGLPQGARGERRDLPLRWRPARSMGSWATTAQGRRRSFNQVVGLLKPDAGRIQIGGHDVVADPACARRACSIQPQATLPIDG